MSKTPGVDYPLLEDYDDPLLYEFHAAGILTPIEMAAQVVAAELNDWAQLEGFKWRYKLFPPIRDGELTPVLVREAQNDRQHQGQDRIYHLSGHPTSAALQRLWGSYRTY